MEETKIVLTQTITRKTTSNISLKLSRTEIIEELLFDPDRLAAKGQSPQEIKMMNDFQLAEEYIKLIGNWSSSLEEVGALFVDVVDEAISHKGRIEYYLEKESK